MSAKRRSRSTDRPLAKRSSGLSIGLLERAIVDIHGRLKLRAAKAVNVHLTVRNWMIGCYIREYELRGSDRAAYGDRWSKVLSKKLKARGVSNCDWRQLYRYRDFYLVFPEILGTLSPELASLAPKHPTEKKLGTLSPKSALPPDRLLNGLSYSQFEELAALKEPLKRAFYIVECLRGNWSVRELRRQIDSLYYERAGLSKNKKKLSKLTQAKAEPQSAREIVRDPYVFEFLGLKSKEVMGESDLENALLDKLENFLLELGHGFCFEARQKRILIDGEHFFVDLVFYHRILKCHVLIELKADGFKHEHLGQLNTYVSWYGEHERAKGDNPPIGILLCTKKSHALVKYALAGIDNRLFVSKYQLELPKKEEIQRFIEKQIERVADRGSRWEPETKGER
ncbi:MAG: cytoplasmic protein [Elusimicrobia bacterium CG_4_9_14_3_um_filter_62_55]|nr:MAG: cytoplasmic protein [Elusimicrobia bacterium CG22_combo_CG10-13_8_21_14_all_63_91]PJA17237.1 MAG: cytoplasmic protein [Elusimicrobia bacterium CG_4_10_14_0_2_um_filter_63_34]PJB25047.1 MAG: cytoplasmic protein [Elusimicrobia bacterium CG_4_9_14_3_um_filter_62_55]